jgi:23S rRNA (uracil1939-C5)-methyltransferase
LPKDESALRDARSGRVGAVSVERRRDHAGGSGAGRLVQEPAPTDTTPLTLDLLAPVLGGKNLARSDGQVTFVAGGIPGERVRAVVPVRKRGYLEAEGVAVVTSSPDRVEPPCPYFGENPRLRGSLGAQAHRPGPVCGGCQYQHIAYARQPQLKTALVKDVLRRIGKILEAPVAETLPAPQPYGYRNKSSWQVLPDGTLAYRETHSHVTVPIEYCLQLTSPLQQLFDAIVAAAPEVGLGGLATGLEARVLPDAAGVAHGQLLLELARSTSMAEAQALGAALMESCPNLVGVAATYDLPETAVIVAGSPRLTVRFLDLDLAVSPASFFQVHLPVAESLAGYVLAQCGNLAGTDVLDVYAGVGTLTIPLARRAEAVIAVEQSEPAVEDAREAIRRLALENVTMLPGDAGQMLKAILPGTIGCVVVDPPRAGCSAQTLRQLQRIKSPRLIYVACDPATLARDLRVLLDLGYTLDAVQPFDLFPETAHVEVVATLALPKKFRAR